MAWKKVVTESSSGNIAQNAATVTNGVYTTLASTATLGWVVDEDDLSSDSPTKVPTQQSVKAYVDNLTDADTQDLSQSGNTVSLVNGGSVDISSTTAVAANTAKVTYPGTSSAAELNLLDGSVVGTVVNSKAVIYGSAGEVVASKLVLGSTTVTSSPAELNILDGVTSTAAELNILDGVTATAAELNYSDGVTSNIQTQLNGKQASGTYYTDSLNLNYWGADANRNSGSSGYTMDFAGNVTVSEALVVDGISTLTGAVTIAGNLTVNGTTTTISTANLEVQDKEVVLGTPDSAYADDAAAALGASGGGISLYTDSAGTTSNFAKVSWSSTGNLTGWTAEDTQDAKFPIAIMSFSTSDGTGDAGGVGSFHYDTSGQNLWLRTS